MSVDTKTKFLELQRRQVEAEVIVASLFDNGIPKYECEFWDYKLMIEDTPAAFAELCRDVISFYNSYGGLLIVGVSDEFELRGFSSDAFDEKRIKQKCRSFCGHDIVVRTQSVVYMGQNILCISIPRRETDRAVAVITVDGPEKNGKPIFRKGNVYFRSDESCQIIRNSEDMQFLASSRNHPLSISQFKTQYVTHNLPDRAMICEHFLGRSEVKQKLWLWLSDAMSRYRVLAGPGGFGKTSAAYSFAEDVVTASPLGFWQVVWLSAKRKQFSSPDNKFVPLAYSGSAADSFFDFDSLLVALSHHLPISEAELESLSEAEIIQILQSSLKEIPTFFVLDDLDSLDPEDQRRVIEMAMFIGGEKARFLITTRKNYIAPASSTTQLPGLKGEEFSAYVGMLEERYKRALTTREAATLSVETEGSPLFCESVFRLMRVGAKFNEAMARWKGEDGEAVRSAAFRRELEQLTLKARRVLFAVSQFESVSAAEVRKVAEMEASQVEDAIQELEQLFLVTSEQIGDEPRFSSAPNLRRLLLENKDDFVPGNIEINRRSNQLKQVSRAAGKSRGDSKFAAKAISQAMAQLADDPKGALNTIKSAVQADKKNADLWMVQARCLAAASPLDVEAVRNSFVKSYMLGKRERVLFEKWIKFETQFGNTNAALDVADKAANFLMPPPWDWMVNVAAAYHKRGSERFARFEVEDALSDFRLAMEQLEKAFEIAPEAARAAVRTALRRATDSLHTARTSR